VAAGPADKTVGKAGSPSTLSLKPWSDRRGEHFHFQMHTIAALLSTKEYDAMNMKVSYLSLPDDCTAEQEFEAIWATRKATDAVVSKCIAELDKELDELELEGNDYATNDPVYWLRNITEALRTWRKANPVPIGLDTSEVQPLPLFLEVPRALEGPNKEEWLLWCGPTTEQTS